MEAITSVKPQVMTPRAGGSKNKTPQKTPIGTTPPWLKVRRH